MKCVAGIWLPDNDTHFSESLPGSKFVDGHGTYQLNKIQAALDQCPPENQKTALDIGAHVGLWSMILRKHFKKVVAFEPMPKLQECFKQNLGDNLLPKGNVDLYGCALGSRAQVTRLNITKENSGNCHIDPKYQGGVITHPDELTIVHRLDDLIYPDISFIKIDVEGYELEVLRGAEMTIKTHRPVMVIEQKPGNAERYGFGQTEAVELALSWGARIKWIKSGDYCLVWR